MPANFFCRYAAGLLFCALLAADLSALEAPAEIVLSGNCPPGFELSGGHCELRSMYQMYDCLLYTSPSPRD